MGKRVFIWILLTALITSSFILSHADETSIQSGCFSYQMKGNGTARYASENGYRIEGVEEDTSWLNN